MFGSEEESAMAQNQIPVGKSVDPHQPTTTPPPLPAPALHRADADEEDESVKQLGDCSGVYLSLQDCLIEHDRNWKSCQKQVQALKACSEGKRKKSDKGATS